jgi:hypothetical protein
MPHDYDRRSISFGFSHGVPRDVIAMLAVVFVTFSMQFFSATGWLVDLLRLTPAVWARGWVWQLLTFPFAGAGDATVWVLLELLFLFFFARDVFARLGRRHYWRVLLTGTLTAGIVALLLDFVARFIAQVSPLSMVLVQGQHLIFVVMIAAFATLYADATIMFMMIIPLRARWFLPAEVVIAFIGFLKTHDLPGFLGICAAVGVVWWTLTYGGFRRAWRETWLRAQGWWMRQRLSRLRRKRGITLVDGRKDPWLH